MGNKLKSKKKQEASFPPEKRAFYLERKTENDSMTSIKKSPVGSENSEDYIKINPDFEPSPTKEDKFSITKSQMVGSTCMIQIKLDNLHFSQLLIEMIVYEEWYDVLPTNKRALQKLKNSNFWFDILNKKFADEKCPNEYHLKLNKLHVICEIFDFQKELRPDTLDFYKNFLFLQNQSGTSPFHLIFQKMVSPSQISLLLAVLPIAREQKELYTRNRRGENFLHCLLANNYLGVGNKVLLLRKIQKILQDEEYEELILQENITDEIPYVYGIEQLGNMGDDTEIWELLGLLMPQVGFWGVCNKMQSFLKVRNEEMFEFFVLNTKASKYLEEYYDFLYIYDVNVTKSLLRRKNYALLLRHYKEKVLSYNIFISHFFPAKSLHWREKPRHLLELFMRVEVENHEEFINFIEILIRQFNESMLILFKSIKQQKDFSLVVKFKEFLYEMIARTFAEQIFSKFETKKVQKKEMIIKPISFYKKTLHLLYETLVFSRKEHQTRIMIKDIHYNLLNSILKKSTNTKFQRKLFSQGIVNLINQLQKYFKELDIGILIIDFMDFSLKNYKQNESLFKILIKNYLSFIARSLSTNLYIDLIDDIFCFVHENRKKNFLQAINNTPLFIFRLNMDKNGLNISDFNIDPDFESISSYECVKLNKPFHLNLIKSIDKFTFSGFKAYKLNMTEKLTSKQPYVIRKAGVDFHTSSEDYRLCLKKSKKDLYEIALKGRFYKILLMLLEWEADSVKEFKADRIKVFKLLLRQGKFEYLKKEVLSKMTFKFKDIWLEGSFKEMKMIWEQIFSLTPEDFKQKFLKSNLKEVLSSQIRDENLFELCKNLRIEVNDIKEDFIMINEKTNGFEMLVDKRFKRSLQFFLDHYLFNIAKDSKSDTFMTIFNNRMKFTGGFNLFETLILNNEFKFFIDNKKRILWEKIDLGHLAPSDADGTYNFMFSTQIQKFFLFCYILDIGDQVTLRNLYCVTMKIANKPYILPSIFSFLLLNARWGGKFEKNEKERILNIINKNQFNQTVIENILIHRILINTKITAFKYVLNDEKVLFEKSICSFRYQMMKIIDCLEENFNKSDKNLNLKEIFDSSKALQFEKDTIKVDSPWLILGDKNALANYNVIEKLILLVDVNYMENSYCYFIKNFAGEYLETGCYFTINILEKEFMGSKEVIIQENSEDVNEPIIAIKCQMKPLGDSFKNYQILHPLISEYKLW